MTNINLNIKYLINFLFFISCLVVKPSDVHASKGSIAIYWGQYGGEGNLSDTCATGRYAYVNVGNLGNFGNGRKPKLDLNSHCDPANNTCTHFSSQVKYCQSRGIKVLLTIGGLSGRIGMYSIGSKQDAKQFADYLWNNFLGGKSSSRPLGDAVLDGINFDIMGGSPLYYDDLARFLKKFSHRGRKVYLAGAPQCPFPDKIMEKALNTKLFDYVWIYFYNNPTCEYIILTRNTTGLLNTWTKWTKSNTAKKMFIGLMAHHSSGGNGYIPPKRLVSLVLPTLKKSKNYGGVMLWSKYWDDIGNYSSYIRSSL